MNGEPVSNHNPDTAQTMPQLVRASAAAYGEDIAVRLKLDGGSETAISYAGLDSESALVARGLIAQGAGKGSRIGFIYGNGPDFAVMLAAISRIGAIAIPISTLISLERAGARAAPVRCRRTHRASRISRPRLCGAHL